MQYDKLVRDRIPEYLLSKGLTPHYERVSGQDYLVYLKQKLTEEAQEFVESDNSLEELADVYEVFQTLLQALNISQSKLEAAAAQKRDDRGGFTQGFILKSVETV